MLNQIIQFIIQWRELFIFALFLIIYALFDPVDFKKRLYTAMLTAKKLARDGILATGQQQEDYIISNIIKYMGARWLWLVGIIGEDKLRSIIKTLYDSVLLSVASNPAADENSEQQTIISPNTTTTPNTTNTNGGTSSAV